MGTDYKDKRQHERVYFSREQAVIGTFSDGTVDENTFTSNIMNLSQGGLYIVLSPENATGITQNDSLTLMEITTCNSLKIIAEIKLKVVRIEKLDFIEFVGLGCQFTDLADDAKQEIKKIVDWGLEILRS